MAYAYKLKQVVRSAFPPPKDHTEERPIEAGDAIQASDGNWYYVVSVNYSVSPTQLNVGPDAMEEDEAKLLAEQCGLLK